jgi:hypothetical protein
LSTQKLGSFFGGSVFPRESIFEAAERKMSEELLVFDFKNLNFVLHIFKKKQKLFLCF